MQEKRELPGALKTLAGVVIVFLLLATGYVIYQAGQVLFPPNTYETALLATVEDTVRSIESSVERLADAADSDREIGRIVTDGTGAPAGNEEPTRLFGNGSSAGSQFSIDSLHFGK